MSEQPALHHEQTAPSEQFVTQLTAAQGALYAYVCTLLGGSHDANDVLQETNLVLWRKAAEFKPELSFTAWAYKIAYFQVLAYRKRRATDRHVSNFSDDSLGRIAAKFESTSGNFAQRVRLLDECIARLPDYQRELIELRYAQRLAVGTISRTLQKSENTIAAALYRAWQSLINCVETTPSPGDLP